jgi:hypothetical protein
LGNSEETERETEETEGTERQQATEDGRVKGEGDVLPTEPEAAEAAGDSEEGTAKGEVYTLL